MGVPGENGELDLCCCYCLRQPLSVYHRNRKTQRIAIGIRMSWSDGDWLGVGSRRVEKR